MAFLFPSMKIHTSWLDITRSCHSSFQKLWKTRKESSTKRICKVSVEINSTTAKLSTVWHKWWTECVWLELMHLSMPRPRGGKGGRATHGNLTVTHIPRVGILTWRHALDLSISKSRWEVNHLFLLVLTIIFCPGVGISIICFGKCQNPHPMSDPHSPHSGLTLIGALHALRHRPWSYYTRFFGVYWHGINL